MYAKLRIILVMTTSLLVVSSCETIRDSYDDCGVWLEFRFDYNMEYADSFDPQVETVVLCVFDRADKLVLVRRATVDELDGRKRMFLGSDLPFGEYKIVTVGNLSEYFRFTDRRGRDFVPGVTTLREVSLSLKQNGKVSHGFGHLYFGPVMPIDYRADGQVFPVPLIRQTNRFNIVLQTMLTDVSDGTDQGFATPAHTVEIVAPEAGAYDHMNDPTARLQTLYRPYSLSSRIDFTEKGILQQTATKINTMRLLENETDGYRIAVHDQYTGQELWSNDLLSLLSIGRPSVRPDGTDLPQGEYFDRESNWNILIVYKSVETPGIFNPPSPVEEGGFVALMIRVNGWTVWEQGVEITQ